MNGVVVTKGNYAVRAGDVVTVPQGAWRRTVRVVALGERRGPAREARALFEETAMVLRAHGAPSWELLLAEDGQE